MDFQEPNKTTYFLKVYEFVQVNKICLLTFSETTDVSIFFKNAGNK